MFSTVDAHCFSVFQLRSSVAADTQPLFYFTPLGPRLCARPVVGSPFMPPLPSLVLTGGASPWRQWSHSALTAVDSLPGPRQRASISSRVFTETMGLQCGRLYTRSLSPPPGPAPSSCRLSWSDSSASSSLPSGSEGRFTPRCLDSASAYWML